MKLNTSVMSNQIGGKPISVLCAAQNSFYKQMPGLDVWDIARDAYNFNGTNTIIAHPPCQQWSRLKAFAKVNEKEKELAFFCLGKVHLNGGVLEHPYGSSFFKASGIKPTLCIDQHWFGFPARKRTWLYFYGFDPLLYPLNFDAVQKKVPDLGKVARSAMTFSMADWLVRCVSR